MSFKFHLVDDEVFDSLPGKAIGTAVGVSYPEKGEAYIRKSGSKLMDAFTIAHELEHLEGKDLDEEYDKEDKCYYKQGAWWNPFGGDFGGSLHQYVAPALAAAGMLIPGLGPAIGGALGGFGSAAGGALSSLGLGGLTSALQPLGSALSGFGSQLAGAEKGVQGLFGIGGAGGANAIGSNSWGIPSVASGGEQAASLGGQLGGGALATPGGAGAAAGGAAAGPSGSGLLSSLGGGLKGIGKTLGTNAASNGIMGMFQPKPQQQNSFQMQNPYNQNPFSQSQQQGSPNVIPFQGGGQNGMQGIQGVLDGRNMNQNQYGRGM